MYGYHFKIMIEHLKYFLKINNMWPTLEYHFTGKHTNVKNWKFKRWCNRNKPRIIIHCNRLILP